MEVVRRNGHGQANICIDCARACGGCSWTGIDDKGELRWEPVPGWTAEKIQMKVGNYKTVDTYHITACPLFIREEKKERKGVHLALTEEENRAFLARAAMGVY